MEKRKAELRDVESHFGLWGSSRDYYHRQDVLNGFWDWASTCKRSTLDCLKNGDGDLEGEILYSLKQSERLRGEVTYDEDIVIEFIARWRGELIDHCPV